MLKFLGASLVLLSSAALGYLKYKKLTDRIAFLTEYMQFVNYLETEIRFSSDCVAELVESYKAQGCLSFFLQKFMQCIKSKNSLSFSWARAVHTTKDLLGLVTEDVEIIHNFGASLGTTDVAGQISHCELNKKLIKKQISLAQTDKEKKGKLYFTLYFFAGLSVVLLLL